MLKTYLMLEFFKLAIYYLIILYLTIFCSNKLSLYDKPLGRKIHRFNTINTSGVSLYVFLMFVVTNYEFSYYVELIISIGSFVLICGFLDDRVSLNPSVKLILLLVPIIYLFYQNLYLTDLGKYEFLGILQLNKFSFIFNILACGLLINSYNYLDGADGLLSSQILIGLIYIILILPNGSDTKLLEIICIPMIINLIFNFLPSKSNLKIFLGNAGSLFLGFFMSFLMIYLYKFKNIHPAYLIWIVWLPVYDFLFVTFKRIVKKKIFYLPDKSHIHHILLTKMNDSHLKVTTTLTLLNILIILIGYLSTKNFGEIYSLLLFITFYLIYIFIVNHIHKLKSL